MDAQAEGSGKKLVFRRFGKMAVFAVLCVVLVSVLSSIFRPAMFDFDARCSVEAMYEEEPNSVNVLALGASTLWRSFSPDYLFREYGIQSYSCCTSTQPPIASYYLLKDALKKQGDSLSVVVLDASPLTNHRDSFVSPVGAERIVATMPLTANRIALAASMTEAYEGVDFFEELIPLLRYHSRWNKLLKDDYTGYAALKSMTKDLHGQKIRSDMFTSNATKKKPESYSTESNLQITDARDADAEALESLWNDLSVRYCDEIVKLCQERGIKVLLVKTPVSSWTNDLHDSVAYYAETRGVDFLDMSTPEALEQTQISYDTDYYDVRHANVLGAEKISKYLGDYLVRNFDLDDARQSDSPGITQDDLATFAQVEEDAQLMTCATLDDYLDLIGRERYTVFIAVKEDAASALDDSTRQKMRELGLERLADLGNGESYVGVLDGGQCIVEKTADDGASAAVGGAYRDGSFVVRESVKESDAKQDDFLTFVKSVGGSDKATAAIWVKGSQQSENKQGINFVVYNRNTEMLLDSSSCDADKKMKR